MFRQIAQGKFNVDVSGCYHCGPNHDSPKRFRYEVILEYPSSDVLDSRGFLLDNLTFHSHFDGIGILTDSCELLAKRSAEMFLQYALTICPDCTVTVRIIAIDEPEKMAAVEYTARPRINVV